MNRIFEYKDGDGMDFTDLESVDSIGITGDTMYVMIGGAQWTSPLPAEKHVEFIEMWKKWKEGKR